MTAVGPKEVTIRMPEYTEGVREITLTGYDVSFSISHQTNAAPPLVRLLVSSGAGCGSFVLLPLPDVPQLIGEILEQWAKTVPQWYFENAGREGERARDSADRARNWSRAHDGAR